MCAALIGTAFACASPPGWERIDPQNLPSTDRYPDAGAIALIDEQSVRFHEEGGAPVADTTTRRRVRILRESGRGLADLRVHYDRGFSEVVAFRARAITPDGAEREYGRADLDDRMSVRGSVLYEEDRVLRLDLSGLPLGSVVEYEHTLRSRSAKLFLFGKSFGLTVPVERARFEVIAPDGWEVEHVATSLEAPLTWGPQVSRTEAGETRSTWEQADLPAYAAEPDGPELADAATRVSVRLASWRIDGKQERAFEHLGDLARWLAALQKGATEPTPELERFVAERLAGAPDDPKEKARRLYAWVQENIRYVAIEIGLGGWRAHSAREVFETRYGDCKDKATLLATMLAIAGIDSHLAGLYSHRGLPRALVAPALGSLNHAVLVIELPGGRVIVDPTERTVPFGELPLRDQETELLLIKDGPLELVRIPASVAARNAKRLSLDLRLDDTGQARGTYALETTGAFASGLQGDLVAEAEPGRRDSMRGWLWLRRGSVLELASDELASEEGVGGEGDVELAFDEGEGTRGTPVSIVRRARARTVRVTGRVAVPSAVSVVGSARLLRLSEILRSPARRLPPGPRRTPVVLDKRERRVTRIRLELAPGERVSRVPPPARIESRFGSYALVWTVDGSTLRADVRFELRDRVIPASAYEELARFYDRILAVEAAGVVIRREGA